ncbi:MAG TPA: hypothetical protein ACQGQG_07645 [Xylella sp.]
MPDVFFLEEYVEVEKEEREALRFRASRHWGCCWGNVPSGVAAWM